MGTRWRALPLSPPEVPPLPSWREGSLEMTEALARAFFAFVELTHQLTHSYGLDLVILTVLVKTALFPLTFRQMKQARLMKVLQPKLKALDHLKKEDPKEHQKQTMELYQAEGVNPMEGCLGMFIQFPIIISIFRMMRDPGINGGVFLRETLFGVNLGSSPVMTTDSLAEATRMAGATALPWPWGNDPAFLSLYWPALLMLAAYLVLVTLNQKLLMPTPKPGEKDDNPMAAAMNPKMFTAMILIFGFFFPAGLILYFIIFQVATGVQTRKIISLLDAQEAASTTQR